MCVYGNEEFILECNENYQRNKKRYFNDHLQTLHFSNSVQSLATSTDFDQRGGASYYHALPLLVLQLRPSSARVGRFSHAPPNFLSIKGRLRCKRVYNTRRQLINTLVFSVDVTSFLQAFQLIVTKHDDSKRIKDQTHLTPRTHSHTRSTLSFYSSSSLDTVIVYTYTNFD